MTFQKKTGSTVTQSLFACSLFLAKDLKIRVVTLGLLQLPDSEEKLVLIGSAVGL